MKEAKAENEERHTEFKKALDVERNKLWGETAKLKSA